MDLLVQSQQLKQQNKWKIIKVNNEDTRMVYHWRRSCVFVVNFEQIWLIFLVFLLLNLTN